MLKCLRGDHRLGLGFPSRRWRNRAASTGRKEGQLRGVTSGTQAWGRLLCNTGHHCSHSLTPDQHVGHADPPLWQVPAPELPCLLVTQGAAQSLLLPTPVGPTLGYLLHFLVSKYISLPERPAATYLKRLLTITVAHTFMELSKLQALFSGVYLILKQPSRRGDRDRDTQLVLAEPGFHIGSWLEPRP